MCFIKKRRFSLPKIAREDIFCYKIVLRFNVSFVSLIQGFPYVRGETYKTRFIPHEKFFKMYISRGFHSYINMPPEIYLKYRIVKCIIPKGTRYYKDDIHGEYVSEKIVFDV